MYAKSKIKLKRCGGPVAALVATALCAFAVAFGLFIANVQDPLQQLPVDAAAADEALPDGGSTEDAAEDDAETPAKTPVETPAETPAEALSQRTAAITSTASSADPHESGEQHDATESGSAGESYVPDVLLVRLAAEATPGQALDALAESPALAGIAFDGQVTDSLVKFSLPQGLTVDEALDAAGTLEADAIAHVQPDYRYHLQETAPAAPAASTTPAPSASFSPSAEPASLATSSAPSPEAQDGATLAQADAALAKAAASRSANLVAGTAFGSALGIQSIEPNDEYYGQQWYLDSMKVQDAWAALLGDDAITSATSGQAGATSAPTASAASASASATPVSIAVMDADFNAAHDDLRANVLATYGNLRQHNSLDDLNHGTHTAGTIGAVADNDIGIAGVTFNMCKVIPMRVSDASGNISTSTIAEAYDWLIKNASKYNTRVVSMSLGAGSDQPVSRSTDAQLYDAIEKARDAGIVTVVAACNSDGDYTAPFYAFPADFDNVVSVINLKKAYNSDGVTRDSSSNYNKGSQVTKNIAAPGTGIFSLVNSEKRLFGLAYGYDSDYGYMSGTSMATPSVAGVLGLIFTANPSLTPSEAVSKLYSTARDLAKGQTQSVKSVPGWDAATGYGEVDAAAAIDGDAPYLSGDPVISGSTTFKVKVDGVVQNASDWTWTSSNPDVAHVTASGTVYGYGKGQAIITAVKGSQKAVQTIDVTKVSTDAPDAAVPQLKIAVGNATYTGKARTPAPAVYDGTKLLVEGKHYTLSYSNNVNAGSAKVTIAGIAPYWGSVTRHFTIRKADLSKADIELSATKLAYTGKAVKPRIAVNDIDAAGTLLVRGTDFKVKNPGTVKGKGKVTVTATNSCRNFTGSVTKSYKVRIVKTKVHELFNARTGQWFYTTDLAKRNAKVSQGWTRTGVAFKAPSKSTQKVWRMYDAKRARPCLAAGKDARSALIAAGWKSRGIAFYADDYRSAPIRAFRNKVTHAWRYSTAASLSGYTRSAVLAYAL